MKNFCILLLLSAMLATISLMSPIQSANAQDALDRSRVALIPTAPLIAARPQNHLSTM
jgi:hypothetical protein